MRTKVFLLVIIILILDQVFKIYIKTHYLLGEEVNILGPWFRLNFIENEGMAFGMKLQGTAGKYVLSIFRIIAAVAIAWYTLKIIKQKKHPIYIFSIALIFAGAAGNIFDSMFYGLIFDQSPIWGSGGIPSEIFSSDTYAGFLQGKVVDMLYFPIFQGTYPSWFPFNAGHNFIFFRPVFNLADSYISIGVIMILVFQKRIFKYHKQQETELKLETEKESNQSTSTEGV
ncbi:MAG: lipoprotein signal peptidase [Bacteroidales bacterium]|nr:lipoprotein signal peptidase [Bacteroidales bacterium]